MTTIEPLSDVWHGRDLPVLIAAARASEQEDGHIGAAAIGEALGIDESAARRALGALTDAGYLREERPEVHARPGSILHDIPFPTWLELTERGRRAVGLWPSGDVADALVDALRQAERATTDPVEQSKVRQAAAALLSVPRDIMVDVTAALIARQMGA